MHKPITWKLSGGSIRLLPERGRILGYSLGDTEALWSPKSVDTDWNLGGERLWLGPESDWFWKRTDKVDFDHYQIPGPLDPDGWTTEESGPHHCDVGIELSLRCPHADKRIDLRIRRQFAPLPDASFADGATGLGLRIRTQMEILGGTRGQPVDLWSLLQVPFGGQMWIPARGAAPYRDYFDPCPADDIRREKGTYRLRIGGGSLFKIGLRPRDVHGRVAYVRPVGDDWLVLERSFPLHPCLRYCDCPLSDLNTQGDALQFFNDGGSFGEFGEMEHRSPALVCGQGPQSLDETTFTRIVRYDKDAFEAWKVDFI